MKKALSTLLVLAMVIACFAFTTSAAYSGSTEGVKQWWGKNEKAIEVDTAEKLVFVFQKMVNGDTFSSKTIKLTNDITINEGNYKDWATKAPKFNWFTLGQSEFRGIFDGQGHTISGLYSDSFSVAGSDKTIPFGQHVEDCYNGLFTNLGGTVKNLRITNAYVCGPYGVGVLAGNCGESSEVVVENVQIDNAAVYSTYAQRGDPTKADEVDKSGPYDKQCTTGGFVGHGKGTSITLKNCLFQGDVTGGGRFVGGLLGNMNKTHIEMIGCGFIGDVVSKYADNYKDGVNLFKENSGGFLARTDDGHEKGSIFTDCFFIGDFKANAKSTTSGSIVGRCTNFTPTNCFVAENVSFGFYDSSMTKNLKGGNSGMDRLTKSKMTGKDAISELGLDESVWAVVEGLGPVLKAHQTSLAAANTTVKPSTPSSSAKPSQNQGGSNNATPTAKPTKKPAANTGDITVYMIAAVVVSAAAAVVVSKSRH